MKIEDRSGQEQRTGAMAKGRITPPLAPPAQLVVVTLWWAEASSASVYRRFTCKTPVLVVAGPGFEPGYHHDFQSQISRSDPFYPVH